MQTCVEQFVSRQMITLSEMKSAQITFKWLFILNNLRIV